MSSYVETQSHAGSNFMILLGIVGLLFLCAAIGTVSMEQGTTTTVPSMHAMERHGTDAQVALDMVRKNGDCRICADGRQRCVAWEGMRWAVVVLEFIDGNWQALTSFTCSQDYVIKVKDDCDSRWRGVYQ